MYFDISIKIFLQFYIHFIENKNNKTFLTTIGWIDKQLYYQLHGSIYNKSHEKHFD